MIGIIFVRLLALLFRSVFVAITLPHFLIKTAFMWFFFFKKPAKTYAEWLKDALRHVRSDAYPTQRIPKMKFVNIIDGDEESQR